MYAATRLSHSSSGRGGFLKKRLSPSWRGHQIRAGHASGTKSASRSLSTDTRYPWVTHVSKYPKDNTRPVNPVHPPRTLVLCFDGTASQFQEDRVRSLA